MISSGRGLGWVCVGLVAGYLIAGWWPFAFRPTNQVSWLPNRAGLQFQPDGIAFDPETLPLPGSFGNSNQLAGFTIELWVEAAAQPVTGVYHLVTLHDGRLPSNFVLCQWKQEILIRAVTSAATGPRRAREVGVDNALVARRPRFITMSGDSSGTEFHLDGVFAEGFPDLVLNSQTLSGRLIFGNAANGKQSWAGRIFGAAIYNRKLEASEVARHHSIWTNSQAGQLATVPGLAALYLFSEGSGGLSLDHSTNRHRLIIPSVYRVPQKEWLVPPWSWSADLQRDIVDLVLNIIGFVPFGFCFYRHCQLSCPCSWPCRALVVVTSGAVVSLTIEVIQVWLPNRVSSLSDLICNTAGTLLGVVLAVVVYRTLLARDAATAPD